MYLDIGEYGVIGNPRTAALVGRNGSIDWCCLPVFHSPAVFSRILDDEVGGHFAVTLDGGSPSGQRYEPETNVLQTTLAAPDGAVRIIDFMPQYADQGSLATDDEIFRLVRCIDGSPTVQIDFEPGLDYARAEMEFDILEAGCRATSDDEAVSLASQVDLEPSEGGATGRCELTEGEERWLVCRYGDTEPDPVDEEAAVTKLERTREYWKLWSKRAAYEGPWEEEVQRSALALKLLTYESTGAVVAAVTASLPEHIGGVRNWDYRFTWIRDSTFSAWSFYQLDYHELGIQFLELLERKLDPADVPPLVDVEGNRVPDEEVLSHLEGYRGSKPVRIGNDAAQQMQWGSYGAMVDGAYFSHQKLGGVSTNIYKGFVRHAVDHVCKEWEQPDHGIWEVRGGKQHFTTSKMWCWVVLDRGIKIAREQGFQDDVERWKPHRDEIRESILENGWSEELGSFKISYGTEALDASSLLMPLVRFLPVRHPKMRRTIEAVQEGLGVGPLLYRYRPEEVHSDPIETPDSAFTPCSFWLIACLAKLGQIDEAREKFEELLEFSTHLDLYAEELDPESGLHLGNFPKAYVHMGLINAAVELRRAEERSHSRGPG